MNIDRLDGPFDSTDMRPLISLFVLVLAGSACGHNSECDVPAPDDLAERFEVLSFFDEVGEEYSLRRWPSVW